MNEKLRLLLVLIEKKPVGRQIDVGARPLLAVLHHRFVLYLGAKQEPWLQDQLRVNGVSDTFYYSLKQVL